MFGNIEGDCSKKYGEPGYCFVRQSTVGRIIIKELKNWAAIYPFIQIYQYCIMPDHVHILFRVKEYTDMPITSYVGRFISAVSRAYGKGSVFVPGINDRIIHHNRSVHTVTYICWIILLNIR